MNTWLTTGSSLEQDIQREINTFTKDLWKEDAITIGVVKQIRGALANTTIEGDPVKSKVLARAYKADGKVEERFGDLAIVVRITFRDGEQLEGVAFYEAKIRDWDKNTLPAAKKGKLNQMHRALWHGHLLIFDRTQTAKRGKWQKRSAEELETLTENLVAHVKRNPNQRSEQIAEALKTTTKDLSLPLKALVEAKQLRTTGQRRGMTYTAK